MAPFREKVAEEATNPIKSYEELVSWNDSRENPKVLKRAQRSRPVSGEDWTNKGRQFEGDKLSLAFC